MTRASRFPTLGRKKTRVLIRFNTAIRKTATTSDRRVTTRLAALSYSTAIKQRIIYIERSEKRFYRPVYVVRTCFSPFSILRRIGHDVFPLHVWFSSISLFRSRSKPPDGPRVLFSTPSSNPAKRVVAGRVQPPKPTVIRFGGAEQTLRYYYLVTACCASLNSE